LQAANCSAGEFTRCVISVSNSQDAFDLMPVAFNLAEQYQISVVVLTDKQIAEALYTQRPYDLEKADIDRGRLVADPEKLKALKSSIDLTRTPRAAFRCDGFPAARRRHIAPRPMNTIPSAPWTNLPSIPSCKWKSGCGSLMD
jgi:Pyruvate:ferredoxin oxidoreductase and related 2-oxoacid:ferredoxin oxidoreductases, alpha subunit